MFKAGLTGQGKPRRQSDIKNWDEPRAERLPDKIHTGFGGYLKTFGQDIPSAGMLQESLGEFPGGMQAFVNYLRLLGDNFNYGLFGLEPGYLDRGLDELGNRYEKHKRWQKKRWNK